MTIYEEIGLKRVINAAGRMTILGVSTPCDEVTKASALAAQSYVVVDELQEKAGEIASKYTGAEASLITSCASAAISMSIAGLISKGNRRIMEALPDSTGLANEVIIQKGHVVQFGAPISTMIRIGGGKTVEVGMANEVNSEDIEDAINEKTVALFYVKSHHSIQKGMTSLEDMIAIAKRNGLPIVVDAASEEDLKKYIRMGADLVIYSGSKAMESVTSGLLTGKKEYIDYAKKQFHGIGRPMKIGKEGIVGFLKAIELYSKRDETAIAEKNKVTAQWLVDEIGQIDGLKTKLISDEAGRAIYRCEIVVQSDKLTAQDVAEKLRNGNPKIYCRDEFVSLGRILLDPRPLMPKDKELIIDRLKEIMKEA